MGVSVQHHHRPFQMRKLPNNTFKNVQDKETSKQLKRKKAPSKQKDEKCIYCGFLLQNKLLLRMHLQFEHENEITTGDDDEDHEEYK